MYRHSHWIQSNQSTSSGADAAAGSNRAKSTTTMLQPTTNISGGGTRAPLHDVNANTLDITTATNNNSNNNNRTATCPLKTNTKSTSNKVETSLVLDARCAMKQKSSSQSKPPMNNNNREWNFREKQQQIKETALLSYSRHNSLDASSDEGSTITKKDDEIIHSNLSDVLKETSEQGDDKEDTTSVISEISDHTTTDNDIRLDPDTPARAVLRESMETDQAAVVTDKITVVTAAASSTTPTGRSSRYREEIPTGNAVLDQSEGSFLRSDTSRHSRKSTHTKIGEHQTINSDLTSSWSKKTFIWNDVTNTYNKFKETRSPTQSKLSSIIEDAQFTALYFCGIDTFGNDTEAKVQYEESFIGLNKEERKREVDDTFLGSVISCGPLSCAPSRCDVLCGSENDRPYHMNPP